MADAAATVTAGFAVQADLVTAGPKRGGRSSSRQGGFDRLGSHLQR
jgi:hypothetical protein